MSINPIGPLSPEEWQEAIDAPYGKATALLRKHDPLWGRAPGEKLRWRATYTREVRESGIAIIMASTEQEARDIAADLDASKIDWDVEAGYDEEGEFLDVEIAP